MSARNPFVPVLPVLLLLAAACGGIPNTFKDPEVTLDHVTLRGAGLTGGILDLAVKIYNPNGFSVKGTKLQVGFDVQGSHVGDILYTDEYQIQKNDTTQLTLPVTFNWAGVGGAVRSAMSYGDIPYTMKGQVTLTTPVGPRVIPFTREGRAPLTRIGLGLNRASAPATPGAPAH
ncbi:MAG TPA: LEA type 2 family protein [Gemmatimonadales bacterium]|nr:LEA type 2 family protein [Gemmatimonadales bacterium]